VVPAPATTGNVSAVQRYQLARSVGFSPVEAIMALAVMLAENNPGNPYAVNNNRPPALPDYGIAQINGIHCGDVGGDCTRLFDPVVNVQEMYRLWSRGGWLQWCTVPGGCNGLPGVPQFAALLAQAQAVAATFAAGGN
jgi:Lysozyme like domain